MRENWKDVVGYEGLYQVSDQGRVKSMDKIVYSSNRHYIRSSHILKPADNGHGYMRLCLTDENHVLKYKYIHRIVAESFLSNPENKKYVHHKNHNTHDNRVENLIWVTNEEHNNMFHKNNWKKGQVKATIASNKVCRKHITINDVYYESRQKASEQLGIDVRYIRKAIKNNENPFICHGKRYEINDYK